MSTQFQHAMLMLECHFLVPTSDLVFKLIYSHVKHLEVFVCLLDAGSRGGLILKHFDCIAQHVLHKNKKNHQFLASRCEPSTMEVLKKLVSPMTENTVL